MTTVVGDHRSRRKLAGELGVPLPVASQAALIADAGVATGQGDPRL